MPPKIMSSEPLLEENSGLSNPSPSEIGYNTASHAGLQSDPSLLSSSSQTVLLPLSAPKISPPPNHTTIGPYPIRSAPTYTKPLVSQPELVASPSGDKTIVRLWDSATGAARSTLEGHTDHVLSVTFSPDGKLVASGSSDKTVRLWDAATGAACGTLEGHIDHVWSVAFSPDGKLVASGSNDKTVRLWDSATGAARGTLEGHTGLVLSVAFSPDGKLVASGSSDETVRLWEEK